MNSKYARGVLELARCEEVDFPTVVAEDIGASEQPCDKNAVHVGPETSEWKSSMYTAYEDQIRAMPETRPIYPPTSWVERRKGRSRDLSQRIPCTCPSRTHGDIDRSEVCPPLR